MAKDPPEPKRDGKGAHIPGSRKPAREVQEPFTIRPPETDHGSMPNLKGSFADSHVRIEKSGWTRETTIRELPIAKDVSGVNMRLEAGGVCELHWHKQAERSYMLRGKARITAIDEAGSNIRGRCFYFSAGIPHSIQGLNSDVKGASFCSSSTMVRSRKKTLSY
ncbi:cupin domain-containing protein [Bradyrhizobium brasilense]|uniref:cupin domain-containing protein n=1 Tax=Bradyrhizobium brasilense TaxID=1419277 RepID=UPI001F19C18B|nr:cupin domain-containing protein [Bradyrhizobium brasilense]